MILSPDMATAGCGQTGMLSADASGLLDTCDTVTGVLSVVEYRGQSQSLTGATSVSAAQLAAADVVLTTYDVLRKDLHHESGETAPQRSLRYGKKYEVSRRPR